MQQTDPTHDLPTTTEHPHIIRRLILCLSILLVVLILALIPPLISVNRYQHRIASSISASLGRPVHLDKVTLNLLPLPGFTLENFVVSEDPAFGSEPIIRAASVRATLRISSLWRRRVEFSTISFTDPSVNLVHTAAGKWNLETILIHAAHIDAAPTAQKKAGPAPRFPYIEATGARINLKLDQEKTPMSLIDADFALWLPDSQQFHLRLQARPARTDTSVSDTGTLQVEGTLGRAPSLNQVPLDLKGEWSGVPLGEATRVLFGHDAGIRGDMTLSASTQGTIGTSTLQARLRLTDARRADFVPDHPLDVDLQCLGTAVSAFHGFDNIHCDWPPSASSGTPTLALSGNLHDIRHLNSATLDIVTPGLPASTLIQWLHIATARVPDDISAEGSLTGNISYRPPHSHLNPSGSIPATGPAASNPAAAPYHRGSSGSITTTQPASSTQATSTPAAPAGWSGKLLLTGATLINPRAGSASLVTGDVALQSTSPASAEPRQSKHHPATSPPDKRNSALTAPSQGFQLLPTTLDLGGKDPATLDGHFDAAGYTLHLTGMASTSRLLALAATLPNLGDGLAEALPTNRATGPYRIDLTATRPWPGPQLWTDNTSHPTPPSHHPHR
jgi:hypothetical protein